MENKRITIIGGGSMGTALGKVLAEKGFAIDLWVYEPDLAEKINSTHENAMFLPGFALPASLRATPFLAHALEGSKLVISATPAQVLRQVWRRAVPHLAPDATIVNVSKGIEVDSLKTMSEVLIEIVPWDIAENLASLSGPSFAREIAAYQPTAVVVASKNEQTGKKVQEALATPALRLYTTDDVVGVELGGSLKNVIAIAVGAAQGMGLGFNSRAALITRGLAEVSRLAVTCGANPLTLAGLAGMGDLALTCTGHMSRNLQVGIRLGQGEALSDILGSMTMVAEGVQTARSALDLARLHHVEMPITELVVSVIDGQTTPKSAIGELMSRKQKAEREF